MDHLTKAFGGLLSFYSNSYAKAQEPVDTDEELLDFFGFGPKVQILIAEKFGDTPFNFDTRDAGSYAEFILGAFRKLLYNRPTMFFQTLTCQHANSMCGMPAESKIWSKFQINALDISDYNDYKPEYSIIYDILNRFSTLPKVFNYEWDVRTMDRNRVNSMIIYIKKGDFENGEIEVIYDEMLFLEVKDCCFIWHTPYVFAIYTYATFEEDGHSMAVMVTYDEAVKGNLRFHVVDSNGSKNINDKNYFCGVQAMAGITNG